MRGKNTPFSEGILTQICHVLGTVLSTGDTTVNKKRNLSWSIFLREETDYKEVSKQINKNLT